MARGRTEPRIIDVFIDESGFDKPRLTLAGAVVLDEFSELVKEEIVSLHQEVSQLAFMKTARSFRAFETEGFHASNDLPDVRIRFVHFLAANPGAKVFIEFSDHTARPDLAQETILILLEVRLIETIIRKYRWASGLRITVEQNQTMNRRYEGIASEQRNEPATKAPWRCCAARRLTHQP